MTIGIITTLFHKRHYRNRNGESCASFRLASGREVEITDQDARKLVKLLDLIQYLNDKTLV
jgi:hypothetical protein